MKDDLFRCLYTSRFKSEVAKCLESFVEKEDEYIKQVLKTLQVVLSLIFLEMIPLYYTFAHGFF